MVRSRKLCRALAGVLIGTTFMMGADMTANAKTAGKSYLDEMNGGVATVLASTSVVYTGVSAYKAEAKADAEEVEEEEEEDLLEKDNSEIVMANVKSAVNVRSEASENSEKLGKLYKDCGGTILERKDGWTKLQSGKLVGWAKDEYLYFGEEARAIAMDVGRTIATVNTETLRVRKQPGADAEVYGLLPKGEVVDVVGDKDEEWICIDYEGRDAYVSAEFVDLDFQIDTGETMEEINAHAKQAQQEQAKRNVNYGEYTADADSTLLLAALIYCEAGGESYEGQVAVGAVVMNRVRSSAYPDSIHGVIYASGQFTPAMNGKVDARYASGKISESCKQAAAEALAGVSNVGDCTHFRRNDGRNGIVIGNHVFY
ncbi:MAG: cell wall hydrolase [Lachnospiraceae bacterium]|nr:cell wall hydrolase [Lachnospiraceae bacterium]